MLDRLLRRFEPQRRQLGYLMGLLVLTFVLTVLLALNARSAELARQQQAQAVLRDLLAHSSEQWALQANDRLAAALQSSMYEALAQLIARPGAPLGELTLRSEIANLCVDCVNRIEASAVFFDLDPRAPAPEENSVLPGHLHRAVVERVSQGRLAAVHDSIALALVFSPLSRGVEAAAVFARVDHRGEPIRVIGYTIPDEVLGELLTLLFRRLVILPRTMAMGLPNDSFFSTRALAVLEGHAAVTPEGEFLAVDTVSSPPAEGLILQVGIRDNAATRLLVAGAMSSSLPLLLALMFAIAGLLVMALLLVRREAELVRLRADFVSSVTHELRTPLAQIRMFTETLLLNRIRSDTERRRSLEIVDQEARRLSHLVENVLLFAKSEGGRRPALSPQPTEFAAEVLRAVETITPLYTTRRATIRTELQEHVTATVDRSALRQILLNLLENALKYGPAGQRVTVGLALFDDEARLWIDDEGPGIPADEREKVFESFYRLDRDIAARVSGSGIGLAVVRELARLHGGDAVAQGAPGGGARMLVVFPNAEVRRLGPTLAAVS